MNASVAYFKTTFVIAPDLEVTSHSTKVKSFPVYPFFVPVCQCFDSDSVFSGHLFCYEAAGDCSSVCFLGSISVSTNKLHGMSFTKKHGFPVLLCLSSVHWCWHLFLRGCYLFSDGWIPSEARENRDWFGILCEVRCSSILVAGEEHPGFVWGAPTALFSSIASALHCHLSGMITSFPRSWAVQTGSL